jgi:hypothetical protein
MHHFCLLCMHPTCIYGDVFIPRKGPDKPYKARLDADGKG